MPSTSTPDEKSRRKSPKISLATYTLRVRERRSANTFEPLGNFDRGRGNMYELFQSFMDELSKTHQYDRDAQALHRATDVCRDGDSIWGLVKAGEHGFGAELVDIESFNVSYQRRPHEAELLPFYFLLNAPAGATKGLLIMQRHGTRGAFSAFSSAFKRYFDERHADYIYELRPHIPQPVLDYLEKGAVTRIKLTTYRIPSDVAEKVRLGGNIEDSATMTLTLQAKRNQRLPKPEWLRALLKQRPQLTESQQALGDMADRVSVTVRYNRSDRTVDFSRPDAIAPYIDVSEDVTLGTDGHPTFESIHSYSEKLLRDLIAEIGRVSP